ncbi:MAG: type II toxin-antitoxin system RatA family toxin [Alphaproteobacteria bacterium]|jgi:coenzyme Q-binding protein COQ10|nr:type II toxin-antitoxin system RatA family toxin [Alphaproteobacteria bacterium]MDP6831310.1 type II toxin-antitoxin system RatA family toxin [Alphaproteobacteria bacterium]MDP6875906.1 type II toxin-antitoxin system RatA family toxin [Alphaproteobacteria bacterium]
MPTHAEKKILPYTQGQMFDLVADIERYPEFLPWCVACRITRTEGPVIWGDLMVGFKVFREKFTSKVTLHPPGRIDVEYIDGPFRYLNNHWQFNPMEDGQSTEIDFFIDFEFRSRMLQAVASTVFNEAVRRMVGAFESRASVIHAKVPPSTGLSKPA